MMYFKMKKKHPLLFAPILLSFLMFSEINAQSDNAPTTESKLSLFLTTVCLRVVDMQLFLKQRTALQKKN